MSASTLLRASRLSTGISQGDLAARAQTSQPDISTIERGKRIPTVDTLERLLLQTGHRIISVPGLGPDAVDTADRIAGAVRSQSRDTALRAFLDYSDCLSAVTGTNRVVLTASEPPATGSRAWDAAIASVTEFWLNKGKLPKPDWVKDPKRYLASPESPHLGGYDLEPDVTNVPPEFLRRNVLLELATLESV
ncbi:MAG: helix-turn-helix domain-containing protein [Lacisediminihabitans sp.]